MERARSSAGNENGPLFSTRDQFQKGQPEPSCRAEKRDAAGDNISPQGPSNVTSSPSTDRLPRRSVLTRRLSFWRRLLLYRDTLHVRKVIFTLPRFPLLAIAWAVIELFIFLLALWETDYSFESLDLITQILKSRKGLDVGSAAAIDWDSLISMENSSVISIFSGAFRDPYTDYCGPPPGSPFFMFTRTQSLLAIDIAQGDWLSKAQEDQQRSKADVLREESETTAESLITRAHKSFEHTLLQQLLCNRTDPLVDQRFIFSTKEQTCKEAGVFFNMSTGMLLHVCTRPDDYYFGMYVTGVGSVCIFSFLREHPLATASSPCISFGRKEKDRADLQWIIRRLQAVWSRIELSAWSWILLSIVMRMVYWSSMVSMTKKTLAHLRSECLASRATLQKEPHKELEGVTSINQIVPVSSGTSSPPKASTKHLSVASSCGVDRRRVGEDDLKAEEDKWRGNRLLLLDLLTASSVGITCANNNKWYLGLAIIRQVLGAAYAEILAGSLMTLLSGWQAFGMVVYHEAIIQLIAYGANGLAKQTRGTSIPYGAIPDVGVLGYVSFLLVAVATHLVQRYTWDFLYSYHVVNWLIRTMPWLVYPACGTDGPCLFVRGDIVGHTVAALYTCTFALLCQQGFSLWRDRQRGSLRHFGRTNGKGNTVAKESGTHIKESESTKSEDNNLAKITCATTLRPPADFIFIGTVGCPRCRVMVIREPALKSQGD